MLTTPIITTAIIKEQFNKHKAGWTKSFIEGISQDETGNPLPWMTYPAIEFLTKTITKDHDIFEFGCGASTLFFSKRVRKVCGLETNPQWLNITQTMLKKEKADNVDITLMEDGFDNPAYENFAKNMGPKFDFIIVDSLKRFKCVQNSIHALKPNGILILDDSERKSYRKMFEFLDEHGFKTKNFEGIAPGQIKPKNTTLIFR